MQDISMHSSMMSNIEDEVDLWPNCALNTYEGTGNWRSR